MKNSSEKCKLTLTPCVWVHFIGDRTNKSYPDLPEDEGLVLEFQRWCINEKIYPTAGTPGTSGPGILSHAYFAKDVEKIFKWFDDKGIKIETISKEDA